MPAQIRVRLYRSKVNGLAAIPLLALNLCRQELDGLRNSYGGKAHLFDRPERIFIQLQVGYKKSKFSEINRPRPALLEGA